jgi:hypothetical protein
MEVFVDSQNRVASGPTSRLGFIPIPLTSLREVVSNGFSNIAANGGVMASDTTPIFEFANGDTDSAHRLRWAATNVDPVTFSTALPLDLDTTSPIYIKAYAAMGGATDVPTISWESHFNVGGTKRTSVSAAVTGTTAALYSATITVALGAPTRPVTISCEGTPAAHGTDTLLLYGLYLEYTRL